ncbi:MAG: family 1 glycosylhydrolase [Pseudomonadota bacterium]|nr:family 1 glycosylhydrolase [Pseudomonadota bacterium]
MIRVISIRKALLAGAAGAAAWELVLRLFSLLGLPLVDLVRVLGTLIFPAGQSWTWWAAGSVMQVGAGALIATFYAYFVWSLFAWRPLLQGVAFGLGVAVLAQLVTYPLLQVMHADAEINRTGLLGLLDEVGWRERLGLMIGHLVYGAVLGALYTRPVGKATEGEAARGSPLGANSAPAVAKTARARHEAGFIFATGVECSYPTLEGGRWRLDQMEATGHYRHWRRDLELTVEVGATHLRYGPPLHLISQGPGRYDWSFTDTVMPAMQEMGVVPIVDLCHFGLPTWLENFQNPEVPEALRAYAAAFADRYPWVRFYTPVNEMFVCTKLSALDGLWNEQLKDERAFVTAVRHVAKASSLMCREILQRRPDAVLVNSESGEFYQPCCPDPEIVSKAAFENERRFLPLDLLFAHPVSETMRQHLLDHGMPEEEYAWFMQGNVPKRAIIGVDYYDWNEKLVDQNGKAQALGELFGWYVIASQYWERYRRPMMHTETNAMDAREAPHWLWRQWHNVQLIQKAGVPVVGFTWYSVTDQVDWDIAQSQALGNVNPVGLFDLNRQPRSVAQAYKHLIDTFSDEPGLSQCPALKQLLD